MRPDELVLVLASSSPRRQELLARLGLEFITVTPAVDETRRVGESPIVHVQRVARDKASAAVAAAPHLPVLAADTSVVLGDEILGKPTDPGDAERMLRLLRSRAHTVLTATAVRWGERGASHLEAARVEFTSFSDELLRWYLGTGEYRDKAGAYAVQGRGALLVARVEGNVQAVVGLPLARLPALLAAVGLRLCAREARLTLCAAAELTAGTGSPPAAAINPRT